MAKITRGENNPVYSNLSMVVITNIRLDMLKADINS